MFNLTTHYRDKNGNITDVKPYRLFIDKGQRLFEFPVKSGLLYYENGEPTEETKAKLAKNTDEKVNEVLADVKPTAVVGKK